MQHDVTGVKLDNGVQGLLINVPGSQVVSTQVYFNSGFLLSDPSKYEMPHITEHLLVAGNEDYPDSMEYKRQLERNGAVFNAFTDIDYNGYYWQCASFEIERVLALAVSQVGKPLITDEDVQRERQRVVSELEGNMSAHGRTAWNILMATAQDEPLYQQRLDQLDSITATDMREYYHRTHTQANARFVVAGDTEANKEVITGGLTQLLNQLPTGEKLELPGRNRSTPDGAALQRRDIADIFYIIRFVTDPLTVEEMAAASILQSVLNSYLKSSLFGAVWESGLAYGINSGYNYHPYEASYVISKSVSPKNIKPLFELIQRQLSRVIEGKVGAADLASAKKTGEGRIAIALQTPNSLANFYTDDYLVFNHYLSVEEWIELRRGVTGEQLQNIAIKFFQAGDWAQSFVGPISTEEAGELDGLMASLRG